MSVHSLSESDLKLLRDRDLFMVAERKHASEQGRATLCMLGFFVGAIVVAWVIY